MTVFDRQWLGPMVAMLLVSAALVVFPALSRSATTPAQPVASSDVGLKLASGDIAVVHEHQLADGTPCLVVAGLTTVVVTCAGPSVASPMSWTTQ